MRKSRAKTFEENYFEGFYKRMVGDFTQRDLIRAKRWFWGWFKTLGKDVDLKMGNGRKVLEIGCSIGGASSILKDRGFDVYASDISKYAVDKARKLQPNIKFFLWDVHKKFPKKEKFDLVFGFEVLEHLKDPELALKNIKKALKSKGEVVFSTPFPYKYVFSDETHISVKSPDEWKRIFTNVGFKNIKLRRRSFIPLFYKFSQRLHLILSFSINNPYINSTLFIVAKNSA